MTHMFLIVELLNCFILCLSRQRDKPEEADNKSQVTGLHQAKEPVTPQKRPADGAVSPEVRYSCTY